MPEKQRKKNHLFKSYHNREVLNTYDFEDKKNYKIVPKKGDILEINKCLFFESDSIVINLKPL